MYQMKKEELEITISDSDRIECAIRHIESSLDVDPWATEIAVEAMRKLLVKDNHDFSQGLVKDTISRQAAIDALDKRFDKIPMEQTTEILKLRKDLRGLPSIQSERKKGEWIPDNRPGGGFWVCSCCKFPSEAFAAYKLYKYCPVCGADMRGEQ